MFVLSELFCLPTSYQFILKWILSLKLFNDKNDNWTKIARLLSTLFSNLNFFFSFVISVLTIYKNQPASVIDKPLCFELVKGIIRAVKVPQSVSDITFNQSNFKIFHSQKFEQYRFILQLDTIHYLVYANRFNLSILVIVE